MATRRRTISKKIRFEVFKRDSFTCQYCGASAPEAILQVDHIDPISKGGEDEMVNYITACQACNSGKSNRELSDNTILQKQKAQLDELNQRREQLEMMMKWRSGLKAISDIEVEQAAEVFRNGTGGFVLNDRGLKDLRALIKKYGIAKVLDAMEQALEKYLETDPETGAYTHESVNKAWTKSQGFLAIAALPENERRLHYVKGILRNRLSYVPYDLFRILKDALAAGVPVDDMQDEAKHAKNWTAFSIWLRDAMEILNG